MFGERKAARTAAGAGALLAAGLVLSGCGGSSSLGTNIFGRDYNLNPTAAAGVHDAVNDGGLNDATCPPVQVRTGASTLTIGSKPGAGEPAPLDVRYQGSFTTAARECHINAGLFTIKVGVEGRIISGPAGGPGTIDVPLRIAVVREGVSPVTVVTKFTIIPVTVAPGADRAVFVHVEPELAFPVPQPIDVLESYVVYVGFDPIAAKPQKKPPAKKPRAKPRPPQPR